MRRYIKYFVVIFFLCHFIYASNANGATINAASCSQSDVQAAINSASDGDIVIIPAGNCTWTTGIDVDLGFPAKALTILGSGITQTIINVNFALGFGNSPFWVTTASPKEFRIANMKFTAGASNSGSYGVISIKGKSKSVRIDHIYFDQLASAAVRIDDYINGVIDNCTFYQVTPPGLRLYMPSYGDTSYGDGSWAAAPSLGTSDAIFVEDCSFTGSGPPIGHLVIDVGAGARAVIRYNTFNEAGMETHGTDSSGRTGRSVRTIELYNNTFTETGNIDVPFSSRGGTGLIHNNTITGYDYGFKLWIKRIGESHSPWGQCNDAIASGLCSNDTFTSCTDDGDCSGGTCLHWVDDPDGDGIGYPCRDQPGRGQDSGVVTSQALEPLYEWDNTKDGGDVDFYVQSAYSAYITENTDYYNDTEKAGYTPYTYPHPLRKPSPPQKLRIVSP